MAGAAYLQGRQDGRSGCEAEAARDARITAVASDAAASAIAAAVPRITVRHQTVRQELEREIQTREVYRDGGCRTGADSLRAFNSTIPGAAEPAPGTSTVPASHPGD